MKYFIGIIPPEPIKTDLDRIRQAYDTRNFERVVTHITLVPPFETEASPQDIIDYLKSQPLPKPVVQLDGFAGFKHKSLIYVKIIPNPKLNDLSDRLYKILKKYGAVEDKPKRIYHITVARLNKAGYVQVFDGLDSTGYEGTFKANSLAVFVKERNAWKSDIRVSLH